MPPFATPADSPLQVVARTHMYTYHANVWDFDPRSRTFSVAPCQTQSHDSRPFPSLRAGCMRTSAHLDASDGQLVELHAALLEVVEREQPVAVLVQRVERLRHVGLQRGPAHARAPVQRRREERRVIDPVLQKGLARPSVVATRGRRWVVGTGLLWDVSTLYKWCMHLYAPVCCGAPVPPSGLYEVVVSSTAWALLSDGPDGALTFPLPSAMPSARSTSLTSASLRPARTGGEVQKATQKSCES